MTQDFRQERAVYHANLIELLPYAGQFVVIRGQEIQGPFDPPSTPSSRAVASLARLRS